MTYSLERISLENIGDLQTLYRDVFHKKISIRFLIKKYDTKFAGAEFLGYLAYTPEHRPAAFYGVLPCRFRVRKEIIAAAQSADTMTHPHHRRVGLFGRLAEATYALAKENGIELIFGFPNQNSLPGFEKLNWKFLPAPMKLFRFGVSAFPFSKVLNRIPFLAREFYGRVKANHNVDRDLDYQNPLIDGVIKDNAFVNYKAYSASFFIGSDNARIWIKPDGALKIGYVEMPRTASPELFLRKLKRIAFLTGCSQIIFMTSINSPLFRFLNNLAKPEDSFPIGIYPLTAKSRDYSNLQFEYCDIDIF